MGTQITRLTRLAAAGLSAVLLFATTACAATSPAETEPDNKTSVPAPTGPINVVVSLNQWGSLAAELGGDDVEVTSIVNSTNVDAHDFEPKTSDVAKLSKAQISGQRCGLRFLGHQIDDQDHEYRIRRFRHGCRRGR